MGSRLPPKLPLSKRLPGAEKLNAAASRAKAAAKDAGAQALVLKYIRRQPKDIRPVASLRLLALLRNENRAARAAAALAELRKGEGESADTPTRPKRRRRRRQ